MFKLLAVFLLEWHTASFFRACLGSVLGLVKGHGRGLCPQLLRGRGGGVEGEGGGEEGERERGRERVR